MYIYVGIVLCMHDDVDDRIDKIKVEAWKIEFITTYNLTKGLIDGIIEISSIILGPG